MKRVDFSGNAWEDYLYWQTQDKKTLRRINQLIKDIDRCSYEGIGKPEPLSGNLAGLWSRRINEKDRLLNRVENEVITISELSTHYCDT
jgi:toxin YoeB